MWLSRFGYTRSLHTNAKEQVRVFLFIRAQMGTRVHTYPLHTHACSYPMHRYVRVHMVGPHIYVHI